MSHEVPLISWVQAGNWQNVEDPFYPGDAERWYSSSRTKSEYAFALTVHGDSMEPRFLDGDVIVIDPEKPYENGSYVIAKNGEEATFKQLVIDGENVYLKPLNSRYPIKDMTGIEFKIVGVVVQRITDI